MRKRSSRNFQGSISDYVVGEAEKVTVEEARKIRGSFWPEIRKRMLEKAIELYMKKNFRNPYFYRSDTGSRRVEGKWILASCKNISSRRGIPKLILYGCRTHKNRQG